MRPRPITTDNDQLRTITTDSGRLSKDKPADTGGKPAEKEVSANDYERLRTITDDSGRFSYDKPADTGGKPADIGEKPADTGGKLVENRRIVKSRKQKFLNICLRMNP